jgi:hypothetical protein
MPAPRNSAARVRGLGQLEPGTAAATDREGRAKQAHEDASGARVGVAAVKPAPACARELVREREASLER